MVGDTIVVSDDGASSPKFSISTSSKCFDTTVQQGITTALVFENENFHQKLLNFLGIVATIRTSRYESVLKRWHRYAISRNEDLYSPDVNTVLTFMHGIYLNGCLYSGLCTARSAITSVVTIRGYLKLSRNPLVLRYLKRIYDRHPPLPKYVSIWDISILLRYYDNMDSNDNLRFKALMITYDLRPWLTKRLCYSLYWEHVGNRLYLH